MNRERRRSWFLVALLALHGWGCGGEPLRKVYQRTEMVMGTFVEVRVVTADSKKAETAIRDAFDAIKRVEALMSTYRADSEISRLNAAGVLSVSPETFACLEKALQVSRLSDGAFDVTVGPLISLWREAGRTKRLPADEAIERACERVGYAHLALDPIAKRVTLGKKGMRLDMGGVAKGYAVDLAIDVLRRHGITSGMVNAGGDLFVLGRAVDGKDWRVKIINPFTQSVNPPVVTLGLRDWACVTSGHYFRYVELDGKRYSHIIDPRTGRPTNATASVTVVASSAAAADALATAVSVLGRERGLELINRTADAEALIISGTSGNRRIYRSSGWDDLVWRDASKGG